MAFEDTTHKPIPRQTTESDGRKATSTPLTQARLLKMRDHPAWALTHGVKAGELKWLAEVALRSAHVEAASATSPSSPTSPSST